MTKETNEQLTRALIQKIGPVDMDLVIGSKEHNGKNVILLNGKRVEDNEALALKSEAETIENTRIWKVVTETLRYQAQRRMFEESQKAEDVFITGKMLLHAISTLEHVVASCKNPLLMSDQKPVINSPSRKRVVDKKL